MKKITLQLRKETAATETKKEDVHVIQGDTVHTTIVIMTQKSKQLLRFL